MKQYMVTGMTCAACQNRVEKAVSSVPGVTSCSVSLLTNSMGVEGSAADADVIRAVEQAGYGAALRGSRKESPSEEDVLADRETPLLIRRLISSLLVLLVLMYFGMAHMMWQWPIPLFFEGNHVAMGIVQMLLSAVVMLINRKFFISGIRGLLHRAPNMDTLVALGSGISFAWSVYVLLMMTDAQVHGGTDAAAAWMNSFYFESAAMILTLITIGKTLEARSKGKTTDALKSLMHLAPQTAERWEDGQTRIVPVSEIRVGDQFVVRPGEAIPVDGEVIEGITAVNEAALTGESIPADKQPGDRVSAATLNQSGFIRCRATRVGEDTTLSQIIRMVSDAAATKAPIARMADQVSGVFVPIVMGIALVTFAVWLLGGNGLQEALRRGISVLVISCPCALGLATPVAIMVGNGVGARHGILFKTAASLEAAGKVRAIALDKTGTVTRGEPVVTELIPAPGVTETELLQAACSLESCSEHPLAKAVMQKAQEYGIHPEKTEDFRALPGHGLTAFCGGRHLRGGSAAFLSKNVAIPDETSAQIQMAAAQGKTPLLFAVDKTLLGMIGVADPIKEESAEAIRQLRAMGIRTVMLTGDNRVTAEAIGRQAGVDEVIAGVLPAGKENVIRRLKERYGNVAMVGDGINDAPALSRADTGMAIGAGADVALDAADVVLMNSKLTDVPAAIRLSRATLRNIRENLFWAFIYNIIGIPLAAGVYSALFGWQWELDPMFGAAAMSLSSFCVVTNALRLNLFRLYDSSRDKNISGSSGSSEEESADIQIQEEEKNNMTKTMKIDGMMCMHCEARVKKALEAIDGVESAVADAKAGTAVVTMSADIPFDTLKKAVEAQDYTVLGEA